MATSGALVLWTSCQMPLTCALYRGLRWAFLVCGPNLIGHSNCSIQSGSLRCCGAPMTMCYMLKLNLEQRAEMRNGER